MPNPYEAPTSNTTEAAPVLHGGKVLAGRGRRLGASLLDALVSLVIVVPLQFAMGVFKDFPKMHMGTAQTIGWGAFGFALWLVIQGYFIANGSQTVGKRLLGIQIIDAETGAPASFVKIVLVRYLPISVVSVIPIVGGVASLVDALCIFRKDYRCVHDHIAGTVVIMKPAS
jgi:uncharacterized RDD family membrane protein YckC